MKYYSPQRNAKGKHLVSPIILYPEEIRGRVITVVKGRQMEKRTG